MSYNKKVQQAGSSLSSLGAAEGIKDEVITFSFVIFFIFYSQRFALVIFPCVTVHFSLIRFIKL